MTSSSSLHIVETMPAATQLVSRDQRHIAERMLDKAYDLGFIDYTEYCRRDRIVFESRDLSDLWRAMEDLPYTDTLFRGLQPEPIDGARVLMGVIVLGLLTWITLSLVL